MFEILSLPRELKRTSLLCDKVAIKLTAFLKDHRSLNGGEQLERQVKSVTQQLMEVHRAITSCIAQIKNITSATRKEARDRLMNIIRELRDASALCVDVTDNLATYLSQYRRDMTGMGPMAFLEHKNTLISVTQDFRDLRNCVTTCRLDAVQACLTLTQRQAPSHTDTELLQLLARLESVDCKE
jgi:hypothetical protein